MRTPPIRANATRLLAVAGLAIAATTLFAAAPALAVCALTDPSCLRDTMSGASGTAGDTVQKAKDTAGGAVDQASGTVNQVVDTVKQTLGGTGPGPDPGPRGGGGPGGGGPSGSTSNSTHHRGSGAHGTGGGVGLPTGALSAAGPVADPSLPAIGAISHRGLFGRVGDQAIRLAKGLAFPAILAIIVVLFMLVQDRIDRRDPKLALAPLAPDVLRFE
jgi:hypothetical protein